MTANGAAPGIGKSGQTRGQVYSADCPCRALLDVVANKWAALAIGALAEETLRFGELQRRLQGISPKVDRGGSQCGPPDVHAARLGRVPVRAGPRAH